MSTRIEIIDEALVMIGAQPLQVETARGAASRIREYRVLLTGVLTGYPWWFATRTRELARLTGPAAAQWLYRYGLPAEVLGGPRAAYDQPTLRTPFHDWDLRASDDAGRPGELLTNAARVWLRYPIDVAPQFWPGYFGQLFNACLQAQFAQSVREDAVLARTLREVAYGPPHMLGEGGLTAQARARDAQSKPSVELTMGDNPLIDVRG